ncbi:MAG: DUF2330 domain-containing protein [Deltaproteobacteria bacterium]|nr:DUF2330 domain-containing protein [Deltaproteobacteria bacterium]
MRALVVTLALITTTSALMAPRPARACGGFFCNATIPSGQTQPIRIVQAGERVLFAKLDDGVRMIVEVRYDGDPTAFAWLLPIPELEPGVELEDVLSVTVPEIFDPLQDETEPSFFVAQVTQGPNDCRPSSSSTFGCGGDDAGASAAKNDSPTGFVPPTPEDGVTITDAARVGPYDARLLEATDADSLYAWLGDNGYFQDPAARPLLAHYIEDGWQFVAVRLANGSDLGDVRPLVLTLGESAPCVPLRLTSIAANDDMPILVWVLGPGRAIPKNFLHAVVNEQALTFPGGAEYQAIVSRAIDDASGRAWVTEHAGPTTELAGLLMTSALRQSILRVDSLRALADLVGGGLVNGPTLRGILLAELVPDEAIRPEFEANPVGFLGDDRVTLAHDLATLLGRIDEELLAPLDEVQALLSGAKTVTRFFTTIDPSEMTRDPIFAFNPELPDVARAHGITVETIVDRSCNGSFRVTYTDGRSVTVPATGQTIPPIEGAPPLRRVELVDEAGPAIAFDPDQVPEVDRLLDGATPGIPTLPGGFELDPAPRQPGDVVSGPIDDDHGCRLALPGAFVVLPLMLLAWRARRRR